MQENGNLRSALSTSDVIEVRTDFWVLHLFSSSLVQIYKYWMEKINPLTIEPSSIVTCLAVSKICNQITSLGRLESYSLEVRVHLGCLKFFFKEFCFQFACHRDYSQMIKEFLLHLPFRWEDSYDTLTFVRCYDGGCGERKTMGFLEGWREIV